MNDLTSTLDLIAELCRSNPYLGGEFFERGYWESADLLDGVPNDEQLGRALELLGRMQSSVLQEKLSKALGWVVIRSGWLDDALADLLWIVTDCSSERSINEMVLKKTLGQVVHVVFKECAPRLTGALKTQLEALKPELDDIIQLRNRYIHASWSVEYYGAYVVRSRRPTTRETAAIKLHRKYPTLQEIESCAEKIGAVAANIEALYDAVEVATRATRSRGVGELTMLRADVD